MYRDLPKVQTISIVFQCHFVLISHHFKPLAEIRINSEQIEAEAAKKLKTMSLGKFYWFLYKKGVGVYKLDVN